MGDRSRGTGKRRRTAQAYTKAAPVRCAPPVAAAASPTRTDAPGSTARSTATPTPLPCRPPARSPTEATDEAHATRAPDPPARGRPTRRLPARRGGEEKGEVERGPLIQPLRGE